MLIPFIDEDLMVSALSEVDHRNALSEEERARNLLGREQTFWPANKRWAGLVWVEGWVLMGLWGDWVLVGFYFVLNLFGSSSSKHQQRPECGLAAARPAQRREGRRRGQEARGWEKGRRRGQGSPQADAGAARV